MNTITTDAWVLYASKHPGKPEPGQLIQETISFPGINDEEILVEPILGCWEANMTHAIQRSPIDVAAQRKEEKVVLGNSGVVRILQTGSNVKGLKEGDICLLFFSRCDQYGYMPLAFGYDEPNSIGSLARKIKLHHSHVLPLPANTKYSYAQWAAFSLRYMTAWSNWKIALGAYRLQMTKDDNPRPSVWGWGGGSTFAELSLARLQGCSTVMISSKKCHLDMIDQEGIQALDFNLFPDLNYDDRKYRDDADYRKKYLESETTFLNYVREFAGDEGVSIFVDYVGEPVYRPTLRALSRQGVITTAGWKRGMKTTSLRASECIQRHIHVHTHYARHSDGRPAVAFAEEHGWMPTISEPVTAWDDIPRLAADYEQGKVNSYFPIYSINSL